MRECQPPAANVVVVDDTDVSAEALRRLLVEEGHRVQVAPDGMAGLDLVRSWPTDLVLLDVVMPGVDGYEVCRRLKADSATRLTPVVMVTTLDGRTDRIKGLEAGADDFLSKPVDREELRARVGALLRLKRYTDDLDSAEAVILSLARTVEARDPYTEGHCERLASYATNLGMALGLSEADQGVLYRAGYLHDVGKIAVPDSVLLKPGPLSAEEFQVMKRHTLVGDDLCGELRVLRCVRPIVRSHHERRDGSGYPDGLSGDAIPLFAQIVGLLDVYDALTTPRPYKPAMTPEGALACLGHEVERGLHETTLFDQLVRLVRANRLAPKASERAAGRLLTECQR
ncbi:MAG: HD domain-containing phosphohydrolase [Acidobacteriota bacterium]